MDFILSAGKALRCVTVLLKSDIQIKGEHNDLFNISNLKVYF